MLTVLKVLTQNLKQCYKFYNKNFNTKVKNNYKNFNIFLELLKICEINI